MKLIFTLFSILVSSLICYSQVNEKPILGVASFTSEVNSKYNDAVTEKVVQFVTNSKRFTVVDRTSFDKVKEELEFQKSEAFMESTTTVKQDATVAAHYLLVGHIIKMSVYAIKNQNGSVSGYKASVAFTVKVNNVETGTTTESHSFQTKVSPQMLSPESALNEAMESVETDMYAYFKKTFPLKSKIIKVLSSRKEEANVVLIAGGKSAGFKEGDKLFVERIELLDGKPYPTIIGLIRISRFAGEDFAECNVQEGGYAIFSNFNAGEKIECKLQTQ